MSKHGEDVHVEEYSDLVGWIMLVGEGWGEGAAEVVEGTVGSGANDDGSTGRPGAV